jgi:hypothetical protein
LDLLIDFGATFSTVMPGHVRASTYGRQDVDGRDSPAMTMLNVRLDAAATILRGF